MSLYCLVYTSVANQKMSDDDLKGLLKKARANNEIIGITGTLLYLDPYFIQVLEGEETIINDRFNVIKQDSRHHKVSILYKKPIEGRSFSSWTMGFNKISDENIKSIEGFSDFWQRPTFEFFGDSTHEIEKLIDMFKHETLF